MKPPTEKTAARYEREARRLWGLKLLPQSPAYLRADHLWTRAQGIRATLKKGGSEP